MSPENGQPATPEQNPDLPRPSFSAEEWQLIQDYVDTLPFASPQTLVKHTNGDVSTEGDQLRKRNPQWEKLPKLDIDSASAVVEALQAKGRIDKLSTPTKTPTLLEQLRANIEGLQTPKHDYKVREPDAPKQRKQKTEPLPPIRGREGQSKVTRGIGKVASKRLAKGLSEPTDRWTELLTFGLHKPRTQIYAETTAARATVERKNAGIQKTNKALDDWKQNRQWKIKIGEDGSFSAKLRDPQAYLDRKTKEADAEQKRLEAAETRRQQNTRGRLGRMARDIAEDSGDDSDALTPPATRNRNPKPETHVVTEQELKEELWNDTLSYITTPNDDEPDGLHFDSMSVESIASRLRRRMRVQGIQERDIENLVARFAPAFHTKLIEDGIVVRKPAGTGTVSGDWIFNKTRDEILAAYAEKQADDEATAENEGANESESETEYTLGNLRVGFDDLGEMFGDLDRADAAVTRRRNNIDWSDAAAPQEIDSIRREVVRDMLVEDGYDDEDLEAAIPEVLDALGIWSRHTILHGQLFTADFLTEVREMADDHIEDYRNMRANLSPELQAATQAQQGQVEWGIGLGVARRALEDTYGETYEDIAARFNMDRKTLEELVNHIYWEASQHLVVTH